MKTVPLPAAIAAAALALAIAMPGAGRADPPAASNPATIVVSVPADARVWFDDYPMKQLGSWRTFLSPPLTPGQPYSYVVTAQWHGPDGADVVRKQQVSVRANDTSYVEFVPPAPMAVGWYDAAPASLPTYYPSQPVYDGGYYGGGRGLFEGYYRVGNVIINGQRWGDIGYRYSHGDLIRW